MGKVNFINAGAGSGKTYTLTEKLCDKLSNGAKPSEFILTTFTKAAADEFKSKIKARLISGNMQQMLPLVDSAQIGTTDSIAQSYVEKYWYMLDMSPRLSIKDEEDMKEFTDRVLSQIVNAEDLAFFHNYVTILQVYYQTDEKKVLDNDFWKAHVKDIVEKLESYTIPLSSIDAFRLSSKAIVEDAYRAHKPDISKLADLAIDMQTYLSGVRRARRSADEMWTGMVKPFSISPSLELAMDINKKLTASNPPQWIQNIPQDFQDFIARYVVYSAGDLALKCVDRVFEVARRLYDQIKVSKKAEGILTFNDIEVLFLKLLSFDSVRTDIAASIKYIFVDEFQDVSPIQLNIFRELSDITEESFWVGDPKQAIYGFRGSDSALANSVIAAQKDVLPLEYSYRSLPQLVNASNNIFINAFACLCPSERLEKKYVELKVCDKKKAEEEVVGTGYRGVRHWWVSNQIDGVECDEFSGSKLYPALASHLAGIFEAKSYKVTDTDSHGNAYDRDLKYGDVAILTTDRYKMDDIATALRSKGLPVSVLDRKLGTQAEVVLVLTLMKYISGVDARLAKAELHSLLYDEGLEEILMNLAAENGCGDLDQLLDTLKEKYQYYSVYDMLRAVVSALDLRHRVCKWSMDQKRQANIDSLTGLASSFVGKKKNASVAEFIKYVKKTELNVPFDNTGDTIKVLTYHKSKGLQWKMVILDALHRDTLEDKFFIKKDLCHVNVLSGVDGKVELCFFPPVGSLINEVAKNISKSTDAKKLWDTLADKRRAEDLRLLYVGFTRAENYLVRLSVGACSSRWLENTKTCFDPSLIREEIQDTVTSLSSCARTVKALSLDKIQSQPDVETKCIIPSKCKGSCDGVICHISGIAANVDVSRPDVSADVFGTCIHNYMAVHKWYPSSPEESLKNETNAYRILEGYGLSEYLDGATLVKQADALCAYVAQNYGEVDTIMHEVPFTYRKNGQVVSGEIDLYIKTKKGEGLLIDFKNPKAQSIDIGAKAVTEYWPQMRAYCDAIEASGNPVDHILIYYPMLGLVAKFSETK